MMGWNGYYWVGADGEAIDPALVDPAAVDPDAAVTIDPAVVTQPVIAQPIVQQPVVTQPIVEHPIIERPIVEHPIVLPPIPHVQRHHVWRRHDGTRFRTRIGTPQDFHAERRAAHGHLVRVSGETYKAPPDLAFQVTSPHGAILRWQDGSVQEDAVVIPPGATFRGVLRPHDLIEVTSPGYIGWVNVYETTQLGGTQVGQYKGDLKYRVTNPHGAALRWREGEVMTGPGARVVPFGTVVWGTPRGDGYIVEVSSGGINGWLNALDLEQLTSPAPAPVLASGEFAGQGTAPMICPPNTTWDPVTQKCIPLGASLSGPVCPPGTFWDDWYKQCQPLHGPLAGGATAVHGDFYAGQAVPLPSPTGPSIDCPPGTAWDPAHGYCLPLAIQPLPPPVHHIAGWDPWRHHREPWEHEHHHEFEGRDREHREWPFVGAAAPPHPAEHTPPPPQQHQAAHTPPPPQHPAAAQHPPTAIAQHPAAQHSAAAAQHHDAAAQAHAATAHAHMQAAQHHPDAHARGAHAEHANFHGQMAQHHAAQRDMHMRGGGFARQGGDLRRGARGVLHHGGFGRERHAHPEWHHFGHPAWRFGVGERWMHHRAACYHQGDAGFFGRIGAFFGGGAPCLIEQITSPEGYVIYRTTPAGDQEGVVLDQDLQTANDQYTQATGQAIPTADDGPMPGSDPKANGADTGADTSAQTADASAAPDPNADPNAPADPTALPPPPDPNAPVDTTTQGYFTGFFRRGGMGGGFGHGWGHRGFGGEAMMMQPAFEGGDDDDMMPPPPMYPHHWHHHGRF